jgi:hypothetical protein
MDGGLVPRLASVCFVFLAEPDLVFVCVCVRLPQNFSDIAPTSNVRTSIHSKPLSQPQVEAAAGGMSTSAGRRAPSTRRAARTGPADTVVTATAPTVQRCYCGTKGCKGFLGAKKLPLPANPASLPPIPSATSSSSLNPSLKRKKKS